MTTNHVHYAKSDAELIYGLLTEKKPTRFTATEIATSLRRGDGTVMHNAHVAGVLTKLKQAGVIRVLETEKGRAPVPRNVYAFVKALDTPPHFNGKMPTRSAFPASKPSKTPLSKRLYAIAESIASAAAEVEKMEHTNAPTFETVMARVKKEFFAGRL